MKKLLALIMHRTGRIGFGILLLLCVIAVLAPVLAPYNPQSIDERGPRNLPPGPGHPLGTDSLGIDILSEMLYGSRVALSFGIITALVTSILGSMVGIAAGYLGKGFDTVAMRLADALFVIPGLPLMILLAAYFGMTFWHLIAIFTLLGWPGTARMVRSQVLSIKGRAFIEAAVACGGRKFYIMWRHILPAVSPLVVFNTVMTAAGAILAEAGLRFLGFGDPKAISWGAILYAAQAGHAILFGAWWWVVPPGAAIFLAVLGFLLTGYALEEILNPHIRRGKYVKLGHSV